MKRFGTVYRAVGFGCLWLAAASAEAAAPRAYVSVGGNDANVCSNPATPCRTFTGAIAQVTSGGEVVVLDSGTFGGGSITQAVTINAPAGVAALAATPIVVNAGASDVVTLRGITFVSPSPGTGTALTFSSGAGLNVENCVFHGWNDGIWFAAAGGTLNLADTTLRDSADTAVFVISSSPGMYASIERTRLLGNTNGLWVASLAKATIKNSVVIGVPGGAGLTAIPLDASTPVLDVENCVVTHHASGGVGVYADSNAFGGFGTIRISNSTVTDNGTGLTQSGTAVVASRGNNTVEGNGTNTSGTVSPYTGK